VRIIEQGRAESADTTSLYVPSIGLVVEEIRDALE